MPLTRRSATVARFAAAALLASTLLVACSAPQPISAREFVVYLRRDAGSAAVSHLRSRLASDAAVSSVTYVSKAEALRRWQRMVGTSPRPVFSQIRGNPFRAWLAVVVRDARDRGSVVRYAKASPGASATIDVIRLGPPGG